MSDLKKVWATRKLQSTQCPECLGWQVIDDGKHPACHYCKVARQASRIEQLEREQETYERNASSIIATKTETIEQLETELKNQRECVWEQQDYATAWSSCGNEQNHERGELFPNYCGDCGGKVRIEHE